MDPNFYITLNAFLLEYKHEKISTLDIGCAEIRPYSQYLIEVSSDFTGLDKSAELIEKAKGKVSNEKCNFLLKNVEELDLPTESFDIIVCNNMLAYTNQEEVIPKIHYLLKPGGICLSYNNNTIGYSLYKIVHPYKPFYKEFPHSCLVILNTWLFLLTKRKIFRTIYNTMSAFTKILETLNVSSIVINKSKSELPYPVINFHFIK